jgi:hypothetical protein
MIAVLPVAACHVLAAGQAVAAAGGHVSQHIRWAGAAIAAAGAIEAVPDAVAWLWRGSLSGLRRTAGSLAAAAAWLRKGASPRTAKSASDSGVGLDKAGMTGRSRVFNPGTADERIAALQEAIISLDRAVAETQQIARDQVEALRAELAAELRRVEDRITAAEADRQAERKRGYVADARVIPVIVLGVVLTAIPDELAEVRVIGYLAAAAGALLAVAVAVLVVRDARSA